MWYLSLFGRSRILTTLCKIIYGITSQIYFQMQQVQTCILKGNLEMHLWVFQICKT